MIWQPKIGQTVKINYKDKSMPYQGYEGEVIAVGRGIKNVLVKFFVGCAVIPRGNINYSAGGMR